MSLEPIATNLAIPVSVPTRVGPRGATAFLGRLEGQTFLITAAHIGTGETVSSTNWELWSPTLEINPRPAHTRHAKVELELFTRSAFGTTVPRFRFINHPQAPGHIVDLLMLPVVPEWKWTSQYPVVDLGRTPAPSEAAPVTLAGFPVSRQPWPTLETRSGPLGYWIANYPMLLTAEACSEEGISGGPVTTANGGFIGMVIGMDGDVSQIIPPGFMRSARSSPGGTLTTAGYSTF